MDKKNVCEEIVRGMGVKDKLTGFKGIVVETRAYLYGSPVVGVQPILLHEGIPRETQWFDESQLDIVHKD